jgi:hypothetical protein
MKPTFGFWIELMGGTVENIWVGSEDTPDDFQHATSPTVFPRRFLFFFFLPRSTVVCTLLQKLLTKTELPVRPSTANIR